MPDQIALPRVALISREWDPYAWRAVHEFPPVVSAVKVSGETWDDVRISTFQSRRRIHVLRDKSRFAYFWYQEEERTFHSSEPISVR